MPRLTTLQRDLLSSAVASVRPGGVVAYATCSPHRAETTAVIEACLAKHPNCHLLPVRDYLPDVPGVDSDVMQLWPHIHGTDAMFLALVKVT